MSRLQQVLAAFVVFAGASVVGVIASPGTPSQIPAPNGVIHACVRLDRDGDAGKLARLVAEDQPCKKNEQRVTWNVAGPQGATGATGATGVAGPAGPQPGRQVRPVPTGRPAHKARKVRPAPRRQPVASPVNSPRARRTSRSRGVWCTFPGANSTRSRALMASS